MSVREALTVWDITDPQRNDAMLDAIMDGAGVFADCQDAVDAEALRDEVAAYLNAESRDEWPEMAALAQRFLSNIQR